jgi:hypothetical protein
LVYRIWPRYRGWSTARRQARAGSEAVTFEAFQQACDSNDRARVYASLARWAASAGHASIGGWCDTLACEPFTAEVRALEQVMFSPLSSKSTGWSGTGLKRSAVDARSAWQSRESRQRRGKPNLPNLNPRWSARS